MIPIASTAAVLNILVNASTGKAQAELTALDARLKKTAAEGAGLSGFMGGKFSKGMVAGAAGFAAVGAAAVIAGKQLYDVGKELDEAYDTIRSGTGATGRELEKLKKDFRSVARQVPDDFKTTGTAIADLNTRLGLSGKPLRVMSRNMLNLSRITETDLEGNIKSVARAFVDWEVPVRRQGRSLDGLFRLSQRSGASVAEIADNMQKFGSPLRTLGYDVGEAAAMFANFERAGVNMQTMVPGLKLAIGNLADPTDDLKGTFEDLGIAVGNPEKGLKQVMKMIGNKSQLSAVEKMNLAMDVFGKRAGADMAEAVKQGRFNLGSFEKTFRKGRDTIQKTADDTNDTGENMAIFWNKVKIAVGPAADAVFDGVGKLSKVLADLPIGRVIGDVRRFFRTNQDLKDSLKFLGGAFKVLSKIAGEVWKVMKDQIRGLVDFVRGNFQIIRGVIRVVSRALRGDWKGAWDAVKEVARGAVTMVLGVLRAMTAPVRAIVGKIGKALSGTFRSAWGTVKDLFRDGKNAVIDVVNSIIGVLNKIPGVDIGKIANDLSGSGSYDANPHKGKGYRRGGPIFGGKPSGDSIPAMLERGEYVLNRNAVKAVGRKQLDAVNFGMASRFQKGGPVGMIGGGIADAASGLASDAMGAARDVLGKSAGWFIDKLPKPNLPQPFTGTGPWLIDHVEEWIKGKVPKAGALGNLPGSLGAAMEMARQFGLTITSTLRPGDTDSFHGQGRAFDASNGVDTPEMMSYAKAAAARWGSRMLEMFYDPLGWFIDNGQKFPGAIGGHSDHVHVAMQRGGFLELMRGGPAEHKVVRNVGKFLLNRGFDFRATAGILGNAWREGLWNPAQMEFTGAHNGGLYGFTTSPVSLADMKAFAARRGKRWDDEIVQTNFMLSHGNPPGIQLKGILNANDTIAESAEDFMSKWERPLASAAGLSERVAAGHDASTILRQAGIVRAGAEGGDEMSAAEEAKAERQNRKKFRLGQVDKLLKAARSATSVQGKKGAYWQILDLYAKYGDFGYRKARAGAAGGMVPEYNEAAEFLSRAGRIASIKDPNRGAGQLYSLVGWLQDHVGLTGSEKANDRLSGKLEKVKESGLDRAQVKRQKLYKRMAKYGTNFPWKDALNKNAQRDEILDDLTQIIARQNTAEWSEFGSEYSQPEIDKERNAVYKLFVGRDNRYRMLMDAIPWAERIQSMYKRKISKAGPKDKWLLPGYRKGLNAITGVLEGGSGTGLREDLKQLVGAAGVAGVSVGGGTRGDAFYRWQELGGMKPGGLGSTGISIGDLRQIIDFASVGGYGSIPKFHTGGIVPGVGEQPAMVMGGEGVFTRDQMRAMGSGNITINVKFRDDRLKDLISFEIEENDRKSDQFAKAGGV